MVNKNETLKVRQRIFKMKEKVRSCYDGHKTHNTNRKRMCGQQQDEKVPSLHHGQDSIHTKTADLCQQSFSLLIKEILLTVSPSGEVLMSEPFVMFALYLTAQMGCCVTCPWSLRRTTFRAKDGQTAGPPSHWAAAPGHQHRTVPN